jgi:hypothetical protein
MLAPTLLGGTPGVGSEIVDDLAQEGELALQHFPPRATHGASRVPRGGISRCRHKGKRPGPARARTGPVRLVQTAPGPEDLEAGKRRGGLIEHEQIDLGAKTSCSAVSQRARSGSSAGAAGRMAMSTSRAVSGLATLEANCTTSRQPNRCASLAMVSSRGSSAFMGRQPFFVVWPKTNSAVVREPHRPSSRKQPVEEGHQAPPQAIRVGQVAADVVVQGRCAVGERIA